MVQFKDKGKFVEVWGRDAFSGEDDVLLGTLEKDGYWWFHPAKCIKFTSKMLRDLAAKLTELNRGDT